MGKCCELHLCLHLGSETGSDVKFHVFPFRNVAHLHSSTRPFSGSKLPSSLTSAALAVAPRPYQLWHPAFAPLGAVRTPDSHGRRRREATPGWRRERTPGGLSRKHHRQASPGRGARWRVDFDRWPAQSNAVHPQHLGPSPVSHGYLRHGTGRGAWAGQYGLVGPHHRRSEGRGNPHAGPTRPPDAS